MNTKFTRDDLRVGYVIEMRNGEFGMIFPAGKKETLIAIFQDRRWEYLSHWSNDLRSRDGFAIGYPSQRQFEQAAEKDIVAVYGLINTTCLYGGVGDLSNANRPVLWRRVRPKKMTLSEISDALGYPVEVIEEDEE